MFVLNPEEWDSDLYDAEIMVERTGLGVFTIDELSDFFGKSEQWFYRQMATGGFPHAATPSDPPHGVKALWTREQVVEVVADQLRAEHANVIELEGA